MARVPDIDNQLLPVAQSGELGSIQGQFREAVMPDANAELGKWESLSNLGQNISNWGFKIQEARNVKEMSDTGVWVDEQERILIDRMKSPEFRANNHWSTYEEYYNKESEKIKSEALKRMKLSSPNAISAMDVRLKANQNQNRTNINAFSRMSEISEMRAEVPSKLKTFLSGAVKGDMEGNPEATRSALENAGMVLTSYQKAGVISGEEYGSILRQFGRQLNSSIWEQRILDAVDIEDQKEGISQLKLIDKALSSQVSGMDDDQRVDLRKMAMTALHTKQNQNTQKDYYEQVKLERKEKDSIQMAEDGILKPIPFEDYVSIYGNKDNKARGEYEKYLNQLNDASAVHWAKRDIDETKPEDYNSWFERNKPDPQTHPDYARASKAYEEAKKRADHNLKLLVEDPGELSEQSKLIDRTNAGERIAWQKRQGVADNNLAFYSNEKAKLEVRNLLSMPENKVVDYIHQNIIGGKNAPYSEIIFRDLQKQELPYAYEMVAKMDPDKDAYIINDLLKSGKVKNSDWKKATGTDLEGSETYKMLQKKVDEKITPLVDALSYPDMSPDEVKKIGSLRQTVINLSLYRALQTTDAINNIESVASKAADDISNQYNIYYNKKGNWISNPSDAYAIQKRYNISDAVIDAARQPLIDSKLKPTLDAFASVRGLPPPDEATLNDLAKELNLQGKWISDTKKDGLYLVSPRGLKLQATPQELRDLAMRDKYSRSEKGDSNTAKEQKTKLNTNFDYIPPPQDGSFLPEGVPVQ